MIVTLPADDPIWLEPFVNLLAVLLGAVLTWTTTRSFERKAQKDRDLAIAYSLLFKTHELCDRVIRLDRHIKDCLLRAQEDDFNGPRWAVILEAIGFGGEPAQASADELALIARAKDNQLVMHIRELEMGHRICFENYRRVVELKHLLSQSGLITEAQGQVVTFAATREQAANLAPVFIGLEDASEDLIENLPKTAAKAKMVSAKVGPMLKNFYRFDHFPTLVVPESEE